MDGPPRIRPETQSPDDGQMRAAGNANWIVGKKLTAGAAVGSWGAERRSRRRQVASFRYLARRGPANTFSMGRPVAGADRGADRSEARAPTNRPPHRTTTSELASHSSGHTRYDVFDRRISRALDTTSPFDLQDAAIERYVYDDINGVTSLDGGNVVLDFVDPDGTGAQSIALSKRYLDGNAVDQILAQEDVTKSISAADRVLWSLVDNLQTVRDLAKQDGTIAVHYKYDSFGRVTSGDTSLTRYLFTSRELDSPAGLQYNRARWYDAAAGRWLSEDISEFAAGDASLTRYVGNSPTNFIDPTGRQKIVVFVPVVIYIDPTNMPADFDLVAIKKAMDKQFANNQGMTPITVILINAPPPEPFLGMQKQGQWTSKKLMYVHSVKFSPNQVTPHWGQTIGPRSKVYVKWFQNQTPQGHPVIEVYAKFLIHEVLYHGVLGKSDKAMALAQPGYFDNTNLSPGYMIIEVKYAMALADALK